MGQYLMIPAFPWSGWKIAVIPPVLYVAVRFEPDGSFFAGPATWSMNESNKPSEATLIGTTYYPLKPCWLSFFLQKVGLHVWQKVKIFFKLGHYSGYGRLTSTDCHYSRLAMATAH